MLIICPGCGCQVDDGSNFCPNCGHAINSVRNVNSNNYIHCPMCNGSNIIVQRESKYNLKAGTNNVYVQKSKKSKDLMYWVLIGFWWEPIYFLCFKLWKNLFFGRRKGGLNFGVEKAINQTVAVCQNCGYSWKIK